MNVAMVSVLKDLRIALKPEEETLLRKIDFDFGDKPHSAISWTAIANAMERLASSLVERQAIPEARWKYLTDPVYFVGGRGKSRADVFITNGTAAEEIFRHPHFAKYLRYFLFGADLPANVAATFMGVVASQGAFRDVIEAAREAKRISRQAGLTSRAAEEFFKLALDCGFDPDEARAVRDSIMTLR